MAASTALATAIVLLSACGGKVTPEKDATLTFGCFIGECVPAAQDDGGDSDVDTEIDSAPDAADAAHAEHSDSSANGDTDAD